MVEAARVLIVEDEGILALGIADMLECSGHQVVEMVDNGDDAIACVAEHRPDLVLMDIHLRGEKDGVATAEILRQRFGLPLIFLTAFTDETTVQRAAESRPFGYLMKPVNERELTVAVAVALARNQAELQTRRSEQRPPHDPRQPGRGGRGDRRGR